MVMCKLAARRYIWLLLVALGLPGYSSAGAADMTITNVFPANNAVEVCADTKLWITFGTAPTVAISGTLQICKVSDDSNVYQLNLYSLPNPPVSTGWPTEYKINLNGSIVNYQPFVVNGNTVEIYPSTRLAYNTAYYVKMTAGFCTGAGGNTSPAITDNTTWRFTTKAAVPAADHDYTVALDGSGDFCTLQGATDAVVDSDPCRTLVKVKKGTYREIVNIPSGKANMTWLGEDRDTTILAVYNCNNFNNSSDTRMMIRASADGFRMYNMTYHNLTPDGGTQAETIKHSGQQSIVKNCKFMSYQDTVCLNGQMYLKDCYLEGDTDYIWGTGTVYFDKCEMRSLRAQSYITQPRTAAPPSNGLFLVDCNLTVPPGIIGIYLGRTTNNSYPYCQSVYINCTMSGSVVFPVGWKLADGTDVNNLRWWEYKSVNQSGVLIDVSHRLNPVSRQLTDEEAVTWRDVNNVFAQNPWNPKSLGELPTAAWQPGPIDGTAGVAPEGISLTWAAGAEATSHMVYFGTANPPEFVGEQTGTSFATGILPDANYYWRVDEKNTAGTTTGTVWSFTTAYICTGTIVSDLNNDCEVDFFDYALLADAWTGNLPDLAQFAIDWLTCNRDPASECWQ
jgi:pectin methylesterase-like acyl-CoA thioesterase